MHTSLSSAGSTKSHSMSLGSSKQTQEFYMHLDTSTASKQVVISMSQPHYQFIEGPAMDWTVDGSLYARFHTWKLKCEILWK